MKYYYSEEPRCPVVTDVMKWFVLPKQVCSLISLLMLPLLPGFVSRLLPPGSAQAALEKLKQLFTTKRRRHRESKLIWKCVAVTQLHRSHAFARLICGQGQLIGLWPWLWSEQVGNLRSGTGARASSIQPRLTGASLLTLFIRPRNRYIRVSAAGLKIKVWLHPARDGSGLLTRVKHVHPSQGAGQC